MDCGNEILNSVSKSSHEHESYTPEPDGYKKGKVKYVVITGSVISGLGKGIFASKKGTISTVRIC